VKNKRPENPEHIHLQVDNLMSRLKSAEQLLAAAEGARAEVAARAEEAEAAARNAVAAQRRQLADVTNLR
jgi:hypothetical protein